MNWHRLSRNDDWEGLWQSPEVHALIQKEAVKLFNGTPDEVQFARGALYMAKQIQERPDVESARLAGEGTGDAKTSLREWLAHWLSQLPTFPGRWPAKGEA